MEIRPLVTRPECEACVALQREIWGDGFVDVVPPTVLMVAQRIGGVTAGAFDDDGRLAGFVFGISGVRDGRLVHWSDMLAVRPEARRRGVGRRLKLFQRELLLALGVECAYWTFDPLVAPNARLNLVALGARPIEYVPNMYGTTGSRLHVGLDTDRLIVEWRLRDPDVEARIAGHPPPPATDVAGAPLITLLDQPDQPDQPGLDDPMLPADGWARVALPVDIHRLKRDSPDEAARWQRHLRRVLTGALERGRKVTSVVDDPASGHPCYVVAPQDTAR